MIFTEVKNKVTLLTPDIQGFLFGRRIMKVEQALIEISKKGFQISDSRFGNSLVNQLLAGKQLTIKQKQAAVAMLKKYNLNVEEERFDITFLKDMIPGGVKPYKHQWNAALWIAEKDRVLIADQPGLGKTLESLMGAIALKKKYGIEKIIVICPVSLKINWQREAEKMGVQIDVYSPTKIPTPESCEENFVLIADECHFYQNVKSQRSQKYIKLSQSIRCKGLINLSATPMKNGRPANLYPVLKAINHPVASDRRKYERRYCDAKKTNFCMWDTSGASNLDELRDRISDVLLRRTKEECLDLPPKTYLNITVETNKEEEEEYETKLCQLKDDYWQRVAKEEISEASQAIVFLGYLRRLSSLTKVRTVIEQAIDLIEAGQSVVIFTEFVETAEAIATKFNTQAITGLMNIQNRQKIIDCFQSGREGVIVATTKTGGVGLTLTRASYLIIVDLPWTPADLEQCEDRIHRIGQQNNCTIYRYYSKDVDYVVAKKIQAKNENINAVLKKRKIKTDGWNYDKIIQQLMS